MQRQLFMKSEAVEQPTFHQRGKEISRIESFSDAVFGFSLTLLVISLNPIATFTQLRNVVDGLLSFGVEFSQIVAIWLIQYRFFRRYNLQDRLTIALNMLLLFVVLFYVYPLRFMFSVIALPSTDTTGAIQESQVPQLFIIYGIGFATVFLLFALMHLHAYSQHDALQLDELETYDTQSSILRNLTLAGIGVLSILFAWGNIGLSFGLPGWVYLGIAPVQWIAGGLRRKERRQIQDRLASA